MRLSLVLRVAALAVVTSTSMCLSDTFVPNTRPPLDESQAPERNWLTTVEPASSLVEPGDLAPDFSYQALTGEWLRLRDLLAQGSLLLVFVPSETQLRTLETERDSLLRAGIVPVAVLDRRSASTQALAKRLGIGYPLIADPTGTVASQFNMVGPPTTRAKPGWFVVDRSRRVRALSRSKLPSTGFTRIAYQALAIPSPDATEPASTRKR